MAIPDYSTYTHPSSTNVFIPQYDQTLNLLVSFIRDPKQFSINKWATFSTVDKPEGIFPIILPADSIRVTSRDMLDMAWPDGQRATRFTESGHTQRNTNNRYFLQRYQRNVTLGNWTLQNAGWDIKAVETQATMSILMTAVTAKTVDLLFDDAQYSSNHVSTPTALAGGFLSAGTITNPIIKTTLYKIRDQIIKDTNGLVDVDNLAIVMNPTTAGVLGSTQEMFTYQAQTPVSLDVLSGDSPKIGKNAWGLPYNLYGFEVIVDQTMITSDLQSNVESTVDYVIPDNEFVVVAKPGSIGSSSGSSFSTIHCLEMKGEQMKTLEKMEEWDELLDIRVSHYFTPFMVAPQAGYKLNNLFE